MTIPTLISTTNDIQYKSAYKKAYAEISQAFLLAKQNGETVTLTGTYGSQGGEENFIAIKKYFSVVLDCNNNNLNKCWDTTGDTFKYDSQSNNIPAFVDKSGKAWKLRDFDSANVAPAILVDTNGLKGPNKFGMDRFPFIIKTPESKDANWAVAGEPIAMSPFPYNIYNSTTSEDLKWRCKNRTVHPCYYMTWITGRN